ncbi:MAG: hypothetical protein E7591_07215 [Ruminococcaceae bacterium]|nr:hypothetical protein [Oscillospiraceae bacterium]
MDNNNVNTKYQNALLYVTLVLLGLVYIAALFVARSCYLPYTVDSVIPTSSFGALWAVMVFPVIMVSLTVLAANILNRKLSSFTIIFVLAGMLFFSLISSIYKKCGYVEASYFTSPAVFFLVFAIFSCVVWDLFGNRRARKKLFWCIAVILLLICVVLMAYALVNYTVLTDLLAHPMMLLLAPLLSVISFAFSLISAFSKAVSRVSVALFYGISAYGVMYIAFSFMYHRPLRILFTVGVILCAVSVIYDIYKFITIKEKKENDS